MKTDSLAPEAIMAFLARDEAAVAAPPENTLPLARYRAQFATGAAEHGCDEWDLSSTRIWEPPRTCSSHTHYEKYISVQIYEQSTATTGTKHD
jgi:hypothetical protein